MSVVDDQQPSAEFRKAGAEVYQEPSAT